jgi:hypothetical protein
LEQQAPHWQHEEVETIHQHICAVQKGYQVSGVDGFCEDAQIHLRVDRPRLAGHDLGLALA